MRILVSIIAATLLVERVMSDMPVPSAEAYELGKRVLVALEDSGQAQVGFAIAARVAAPDSGIVRGLLGSAPADKRGFRADARISHLPPLRELSTGTRPTGAARARTRPAGTGPARNAGARTGAVPHWTEQACHLSPPSN